MTQKDSSMENRYVLGQGMMGGIKGSYGRYSVGPRVNNLSAQFNDYADSVEEQKRRRFKRKRESGYTGAGFWFGLYPNMVAGMGSGTGVMNPDQVPVDGKTDQTAAVTDATGGTAFNGAAGVS
jgi:hypothetical protein